MAACCYLFVAYSLFVARCHSLSSGPTQWVLFLLPVVVAFVVAATVAFVVSAVIVAVE